MKKVSVILIAIVLVLTMGQATFAKDSISLNGGFLKTGYNSHWGVESLKGFNFGISGEHEFADSFSIVGEISISKISSKNGWENEIASLFFTPSVYIKYKVFTMDGINLGVQMGLSDVFSKIKYEDYETKIHNFLYVGLGVYANAYVFPGIQVSADLKLPVAVIATESRSYSEGERYENTVIGSPIGVRNASFVDLKLGISYDIQPDVAFGVEGRVSNLGPICYDCYRYNYYDGYSHGNMLWNYSIGVKVVYNF